MKKGRTGKIDLSYGTKGLGHALCTCRKWGDYNKMEKEPGERRIDTNGKRKIVEEMAA